MDKNVNVKALIIFDGKVLLLKNITENEYFGKFDIPGGKIEDDESILQSLDRWLLKEIGMKFDSYKLYHADVLNKENTRVFIFAYLVELNNIIIPKLPDKRVEYVWTKVEDIANQNITDELKSIVKNKLTNNEAKKTTNKTEAKLFTDGGSRGNPGPSALGYAIYDQDEKVVKKGSRYLGLTTNNQAEYQALKEGLQECLNIGFYKVEVYMDSQLVANQMNGIYKIKNRELWPIHESIKKVAKEFKGGVRFNYVPRELNKEADSMVNEELDRIKKR